MLRRILLVATGPFLIPIGIAGVTCLVYAVAGDFFAWLRGESDDPMPFPSERILWNPPFDLLESWFEWCNRR